MNTRIYMFVKYTILVLLVGVVMVPLIYVVLSAFTPLEDIGRYVYFPRQLSLRNFIVVLTKTRFLRYMGNTLFLAVTITLGSALINSMAAYSLARIRYKGRSLIFLGIVATLVLPGEVMIIPQFMLVSRLGWVDSYNAIIFPALSGAFGIFFMRQFLLGLPFELEDAASIDGCSRFGTFIRIVLPLLKAPLMTVSLLTFFGVWDSFLWPMTVINSPEKHVLQVAISVLNTEEFTDVGAQYANVVLSSAPIVLLFLFVQRYYIAGITSGAVKG